MQHNRVQKNYSRDNEHSAEDGSCTSKVNMLMLRVSNKNKCQIGYGIAKPENEEGTKTSAVLTQSIHND